MGWQEDEVLKGEILKKADIGLNWKGSLEKDCLWFDGTGSLEKDLKMRKLTRKVDATCVD